MSKSFKAETVEIDLELTTLEANRKAKDEGSEPEVTKLSLKIGLVLSADKVTSIVREWTTLEKKREEDKGIVFEVMATELAMLYDRPKEWWLENFDTNTLNEILKHVAREIARVKKSTKN